MTDPNQPRPALRFRGKSATERAKKQTDPIDKDRDIGTFVDIRASRTKVAPVPGAKSVEVNKSGISAKPNPQNQCENCACSFIRRADLNKHMRLKHPKEWEEQKLSKEKDKLGLMYNCDACGESFNKK